MNKITDSKRKTQRIIVIVAIIVLALVALYVILDTVGIIQALITGYLPIENDCGYKFEDDGKISYYVGFDAEGDVVCPERFLFWDITEVVIPGCPAIRSVTVNSRTDFISTFLDGCSSFEGYIVDENNPYFYSKDGVVFSKDGKTLVSYPAGKKDTVYELPVSVEEIGLQAINEIFYLETLIIRNENLVVHKYPQGFEFTNKIVNIYVPDNLVETYRAADGWKEYAEYIFPIAE